MAFLFGESLPAVGLHVEWTYMVIFGAASVLASWLFVRGLKLIDAGVAGILGLMEIVFAILFGIAFFREQLNPMMTLGVAAIIVAATIPYSKEFGKRMVRTHKI
jgi:drug/metabolite transporter (DMT)-like permease